MVDGDQAIGRSYALNIRWDADAGRFWVARVSANTWRWVRTPQGWRITERINALLDGTPGHREMLAPPAQRRRDWRRKGRPEPDRQLEEALKIGFIGPGRMGRPMLGRLVAAGHDVTVLVRRPEARAAAEADGLTCASTVAAAVRDADAVFVVVLTDEQVRSVCLAPDGAVAAMKPGATLVQHTTSDPATAQLLAEAGADRGIGVLDAALSGGPHDIAAGRLTLWVGGDEALLAEMRPLLQTYASPIMFVGPTGNGQRAGRIGTGWSHARGRRSPARRLRELWQPPA